MRVCRCVSEAPPAWTGYRPPHLDRLHRTLETLAGRAARFNTPSSRTTASPLLGKPRGQRGLGMVRGPRGRGGRGGRGGRRGWLVDRRGGGSVAGCERGPGEAVGCQWTPDGAPACQRLVGRRPRVGAAAAGADQPGLVVAARRPQSGTGQRPERESHHRGAAGRVRLGRCPGRPERRRRVDGRR